MNLSYPYATASLWTEEPSINQGQINKQRRRRWRRWNNKCGLVKGFVGIELGSIQNDLALAVKMGRVRDLVNNGYCETGVSEGIRGSMRVDITYRWDRHGGTNKYGHAHILGLDQNENYSNAVDIKKVR